MGLAYTGVIDFHTAAALVLGENIGTTITAFLAALVIGSPVGISLALAHLFFNLLGGMTTAIYAEPPRENDADNPVRRIDSVDLPPVTIPDTVWMVVSLTDSNAVWLVAAEAEAGYTAENPLEITIYFVNDGRYSQQEEQYVTAAAQQLTSTGVFLAGVEGAPWEQFRVQMSQCGYPAYLLGWPSPGSL